MIPSLKLFAVTLTASNLEQVSMFYSQVFSVEPIFQDKVSRVYRFGETLINVLDREDAVPLFAPAETAQVGFPQHSMLTLKVEDIDSEAARLESIGVALNYGPVDQPWGIRVITFKDPTGQLWEFSQDIE